MKSDLFKANPYLFLALVAVLLPVACSLRAGTPLTGDRTLALNPERYIPVEKLRRP